MKTAVAPTCEHCEQPLPVMARRHARFCSVACKQAAYRARKARAAEVAPLPDELTTRARWVRYSSAKVPLTTAGRAASSIDLRTWSPYTEAAASTAGVGLGFVLSDTDDIACVDLDHCIRPDGSLESWAVPIVAGAGTTYVEVSPSGTGLHIWGRADVRQGRRIRRPDGTAVEVYGTGRYITVTGRRHGDCPSRLGDLSGLVAYLVSGSARFHLAERGVGAVAKLPPKAAERTNGLDRFRSQRGDRVERLPDDPNAPADEADDGRSPAHGFQQPSNFPSGVVRLRWGMLGLTTQ
ncbi:hypothetical protein ACFVHB_19980 [Kitasatospora sp. NPDC127111]|uniref:hypothetical protein n=1 Tax=Kitasatospora sp. NPDC127111 TaxID=3345363 RepID=UPI003645C4A8